MHKSHPKKFISLVFLFVCTCSSLKASNSHEGGKLAPSATSPRGEGVTNEAAISPKDFAEIRLRYLEGIANEPPHQEDLGLTGAEENLKLLLDDIFSRRVAPAPFSQRLKQVIAKIAARGGAAASIDPLTARLIKASRSSDALLHLEIKEYEHEVQEAIESKQPPRSLQDIEQIREKGGKVELLRKKIPESDLTPTFRDRIKKADERYENYLKKYDLKTIPEIPSA